MTSHRTKAHSIAQTADVTTRAGRNVVNVANLARYPWWIARIYGGRRSGEGEGEMPFVAAAHMRVASKDSCQPLLAAQHSIFMSW
jgi:hypothetical protein